MSDLIEQAKKLARYNGAETDNWHSTHLGTLHKQSAEAFYALIAEITRLTEALAASEEARRAERAAVVRECAEAASAGAEIRHGHLSTDPQEAFAQGCNEASSAILALATDADTSALDKLLREARKAKKLKWDDFGEHGAKACAMLNSSYLIQLWRGRGEYELSVSVPGYGSAFDGPQFYPTLEAAKAAAQADYEARILAALEAPQ